jgi:glycosyltransferase involved in cell wall biosynthesis
MDRGGAESWLMAVLATLDRTKFNVDFLTNRNSRGEFDDEITAYGSRILRCPDPHRPWRYMRRFGRLLADHGPYDIVHSHVQNYSGIVLAAAAMNSVPVRIAHSHSDTRIIDARASLVRRSYIRTTRSLISSFATAGLAVSRAAAASLFGDTWTTDPKVSVLYCGVDVQQFRQKPCGATLRRSLNIPADARVYVHVGRFAPPKNHRFLVEICQRLAVEDPKAAIVFVGDGLLRSSIETAVRQSGLTERIIFAGTRSDVPQLLTGLADVLLLPSLWEGLPIVLLEAQAAGVPCLCSDVVTAEADERPQLIRRLGLGESAQTWAMEAVSMAARRHEVSAGTLEGTRFDIRVGVRALEEFYLRCVRNRLKIQ